MLLCCCALGWNNRVASCEARSNLRRVRKLSRPHCSNSAALCCYYSRHCSTKRVIVILSCVPCSRKLGAFKSDTCLAHALASCSCPACYEHVYTWYPQAFQIIKIRIGFENASEDPTHTIQTGNIREYAAAIHDTTMIGIQQRAKTWKTENTKKPAAPM